MIVSNPSVTSDVFTAGISIIQTLNPGVISATSDELVVYKNGSFINIKLLPSVAFVCNANINARDCHLTVEIIQPEQDSSSIALSRCHLSLISGSFPLLSNDYYNFFKSSLLSLNNFSLPRSFNFDYRLAVCGNSSKRFRQRV